MNIAYILKTCQEIFATRVGHRRPTEFPTWVTLEVAHGGFATGHPSAKLPEGKDNMEWLSDEGMTRLKELFDTRRYSLKHPEEGAFLVLWWLLANGEDKKGTKLLKMLTPYFETLKFYPEVAPHPVETPAGKVFISKPDEVVASLSSVLPCKEASRFRRMLKSHETRLTVTQPFEDRLIAHLLTSFETPPTRSRTTKAEPFVYSGGYPFIKVGPGWAEKLKEILKDAPSSGLYPSLALLVRVCKRYVAKKKVTRGDAVEVVKVLAKRIEQQERNPRLRDEQRTQWATFKTRDSLPALTKLVGVLKKLPATPRNRGMTDTEAAALCELHGFSDNKKIEKILTRCTFLPIKTHVERRNVKSLDSLARPIQQLVAGVQSSRFAASGNVPLSYLYDQLYIAFRERRSLLLLNYQQQVKVDEVPWIKMLKVLATKRKFDDNSQPAYAALMVEIGSLVFGKFPSRLIPNKLVQELEAVRAEMGGDGPKFVEELAADIFMSGFSKKFKLAAVDAAKMLRGTTYERYYGVEQEFATLQEDTPCDFDELAKFLAPDIKSMTCAANGKHIEGAMILTTHNLAAVLSLLPSGAVDHSAAVIAISEDIEVPFSLPPTPSHLKTFAYGFRQLLFHLSLVPLDQQQSLLARIMSRYTPPLDESKSRLLSIYDELLITVNGGTPDKAYVVTAWHFACPVWWRKPRW